MIQVYIAHRLGSDPVLRADNIEIAGRRMCELADRLHIVPAASWLTLARYWPETKRENAAEWGVLVVDLVGLTMDEIVERMLRRWASSSLGG